jgi:hypothetical protein
MKYFQILITIILFSLNLHSQDLESLEQKNEFAIGIGGNYSIDSYTFDMPTIPEHFEMRYKNGTGNSFSRGIEFLWRINRISFSWNNSVLFSAGYYSSDFTSIYDDGVDDVGGGALPSRVTVINPDGTKSEKLVESKINIIAEAKHEYLFFSSIFRQQILDLDLHVSLGISFNFLRSSELTSKMNMQTEGLTFKPLEPDSPYRLSKDKKSYIFQEGSDPDAETFVFYLPIGIDYEFSLYDFSIIPHIQYSIPLTKMNVEWNMARTSYAFGLKVLYNLD